MRRPIGSLAQIPKGEGRTYDIDGTRIAVFHTHAGEVFATQASCPHRAGPLADGLLGGTVVVCPLHDRNYDMRTGAGVNGTEECIAVYPTEVSPDGQITLTLA